LSWFSQVPWLVASGRKIILIDSRGHGDSELGDSVLSYRLLATDAVHVLDQLDIRKTDVIGWSDGANTALLLARYWPQRVGKIVAISGNFDPSGIKPEGQDDNNNRSSGLNYWLKRWWTGAGEQFLELEDKIKNLWQNGPKLRVDDLSGINIPVMVIIGEYDLITLSHAQKMAASLPYSKLEIVPDGGHTTLITHAFQVNQLISKFLAIPNKNGIKQP
jgi:pimeloyl-ACP methyl ester carboxylesterase